MMALSQREKEIVRVISDRLADMAILNDKIYKNKTKALLVTLQEWKARLISILS